ncbi:MAG: phage major capsid protein [Limisphaerales bacterium]
MNAFLKKFPHLIALSAVCLWAVVMVMLGAPVAAGIVFVALWQLSQLALSPRFAGFLATCLTDAQLKEFSEIMEGLKEMGDEFPKLRGLADRVDAIQKDVGKLKKGAFGGPVGHAGVRWLGNIPFVSDECAEALTATFVCGAELAGRLETYVHDETKRKSFLERSRSILGIQQRAGGALTPTDIPLPTIYMPQVIELVFAYGQARQFATVFPLGAGTVKLPRLQAGEDTFGFLGAGTAGMSTAVPEKEVEAALVTFTANKCGGLIRIPSELEEDSFIALGQFLARYIARQLAKLEDNTLFNADGTGTYANITGIGSYCVQNPAYLRTLGAGKTTVTDATVADFRALRGLVNPAVLYNMAANGQTQSAYYMHPSLESLMVTFNVIGSPQIYIPPTPGRPAMLDGFPIRWIGVSQANTGIAAPNAFAAFFGDLSFWYLGERGAPRVEVSREVFFATDELAMRALERIDVEAMAVDAMSTLQLAAA